MSKIEEFQQVVLTDDVPMDGLVVGDVGTVVDISQNGEGYIIEFFTLDGETVAVVPVIASQIRPPGEGEIAHVRVHTNASVTATSD